MNKGSIAIRVVRVLALAGTVALGACGWAEWPPPSWQPQAANSPPSSRPAAAASSDRGFVGAEAVVVGKGDTVHALSRRHRVGVRAIIEANRLRPPYYLDVGQRIVLPRRRVHTVARGETLNGISRAYDTDTFVLARTNDLAPPYTIYVGQRLTVPGHGGRRATANSTAPAVARRKSAAPAPAANVRRGTIARPPAATGKGFLWPVRGPMISSFGNGSKGLHNDGINIAAPLGSPVWAAENGVVAYAGNELRGFGNLLLIKHAGGWITAYAHNGELLVARGDRVRKGQTIARVGSSGNVSKPQLHFELRRGKHAVDPRKHLRDSNA